MLSVYSFSVLYTYLNVLTVSISAENNDIFHCKMYKVNNLIGNAIAFEDKQTYIKQFLEIRTFHTKEDNYNNDCMNWPLNMTLYSLIY